MSIEKCFKIVSNMGTFILEHVGEIMAVKNISICGTQFQDGSNFFLINKFIIVKKKEANRITFTRFSWYSITANMAQRSQRGKRKDERSTDDGMEWL